MRENALELHGVCKKYGGFALRNVGFTLTRGTVMGLIGENGAGVESSNLFVSIRKENFRASETTEGL